VLVCSLRLVHVVPEHILAAVCTEVRGRRAADLRVEPPSSAARACNLQSWSYAIQPYIWN
jgi:hypothetical protein